MQWLPRDGTPELELTPLVFAIAYLGRLDVDHLVIATGHRPHLDHLVVVVVALVHGCERRSNPTMATLAAVPESAGAVRVLCALLRVLPDRKRHAHCGRPWRV